MLMMNITGFVKDKDAAERIEAMLKSADMKEILTNTCPRFEDWMNGLPVEPIKGLADECWQWIRYWGNGGGDYSTEECIQGAITDAGTDSPRTLAEAMYNSIADYSKTPFEASVLVMQIVDESMAEVSYEGKEE